MNLYGKLINGILEYAPECYEFKEGYKLNNFNTNIQMMKYYGFKPIVENKPSYDKNSENLKVISYDETPEEIIVNYEIIKILSNKELEEKLMELENENIQMLILHWDLDFRVFEIEFIIGSEAAAMICSVKNKNMLFLKGVNDMALTRYDVAKKLIMFNEYDKETMTYQLTRYMQKGAISQEEYDELLTLMDNNEIIQQTK